VLDWLRAQGHALVDADQVDAKLARLLEDREGDLRVVHPPGKRPPVVVAHVVELESPGAELLDLDLHQVEGPLPLQWVDRPPEHRALRAPAGELGAPLPG